MEDQAETMVETREELMVSPTRSRKPTLRIAHFLKPTVASMEGPSPKPSSFFPSSSWSITEPRNWPLEISFCGWRHPSPDWKSWVGHMEGKYQSLWRKAGIHAAIISSTCTFRRNNDLIMSLGEKWCPETNTFVFPWGEATITLEDVAILGGYSVLGSPVFSCFVEGRDVKKVEKRLHEAKREISRGSSGVARQNEWMKKFMDNGSEIEHEAFLSYWIARYVFHDSKTVLKAHVFPMAIRLSRGERIAFAPAVLACIYRDLSLLKTRIVAAAEIQAGEDGNEVPKVMLWSQLQLVQLWVLERFPFFQPKRNAFKSSGPRSALWDNRRCVEVDNVRLALDSAGDSFCWRPYAAGVNGWQQLYKKEEQWCDLQGSEDLLVSFALCLRVSELVGLDCIEQYLPHRVAMQFGLDQDLPGHVARSIEHLDIAWFNYIRPFDGTKLYLPPRLFKPCVTVRYLKGWRENVQDVKDGMKGVIVTRRRSSRKRQKKVSWGRTAILDDNCSDFPPGFPPEPYYKTKENIFENVKPKLEQILTQSEVLREIQGLEALSQQANAVEMGSIAPLEGGSEGSAGVPVVNNAYEFGMPNAELEARIVRLERVVFDLKAAARW